MTRAEEIAAALERYAEQGTSGPDADEVCDEMARILRESQSEPNHNSSHKETAMDVERIAMVCHEANRAYCAAIGDTSQRSWDEAPDWQRVSAINGVALHLANPQMPVWASHDAWMQEKINHGWVYGTEKDAEAKTHPCIVPFSELPKEQQAKDALFAAIVRALR